MKKYVLIPAGVLSVMLMASCSGSSDKEQNAEDTSATTLYQTREELVSTLATQDSLFALINDISADMAQIKQMEQIVATPGSLNGESASKKEQIKNDLVAVSQALQQRRQRLAELEKKLKDSNSQNGTLLKTIETLKTQIAQQEREIGSLKDQLAQANIQISNLNQAVDSLNVSVATEKEGKEKAIQQADALTTELNTCYYAIGSKKELEDNNIIKTGFLRKTKIMQGDYEMSYFTAVDKRTLTRLPLHSSKAKVMTNQPVDSYRIDDNGGQKVLVITNPAKFWGTSNFLVIQID
ncbi:MAG: hypothetical protein NC043_03435 [Muribaculaceae bacterium]|nr:hypothetical protein [Muribaculaceae bacterium]